MPEHELAEAIKELRSTIAGTESLSADDRSRLDELIERVQAAVGKDSDGILGQLDDARSRFETDHVDLVRIVNRIADIFSAGGI